MTKGYFVKQLKKAGDGIIYFNNNRIAELGLCTADFSNEYIKQKRKTTKVPRFTKKAPILVFSWTLDSFMRVNPHDVKFVEPLKKVLNNPGRE